MWISLGYLRMMVGTILCKYPNFVKQLPGAGPVALLYIVDCVLCIVAIKQLLDFKPLLYWFTC